MKYAVITSKNEFGQMESEGKAILLNKMDHRDNDQNFWEVRFIDGNLKGKTGCRWISNISIKDEGSIE